MIKFFIYTCFNPVLEIIVFICTELFLSNMLTVQFAQFNKRTIVHTSKYCHSIYVTRTNALYLKLTLGLYVAEYYCNSTLIKYIRKEVGNCKQSVIRKTKNLEKAYLMGQKTKQLNKKRSCLALETASFIHKYIYQIV